MQTRTLGRSGLEVSSIGFGAMALSGGYEPVEESDASATIDRALELGVTLIDTADFYTKGARTASAEWGHNEKLIGRSIARRRNQVVLATKGGYTFGADSGITVDGRPDYIRRACDGSLQRLGVDTIDLYYLHRVDPQVPVAESVGAMADLVRQGKVRHIGLSEPSAADIRSAHATHPIAAVQSEYSLFNREPEIEVIPLCRELGIGFVPFAALSRGLLTGTIKRPDDMVTNDWRRASAPRFSETNLTRNLQLVDRLGAIAERLGATIPQAAIAWILHQGAGIVPLIGATRPEFLEDNLRAASLILQPADVAQINDIFPIGAASGARFPEAFLRAVRT